MPLSYRDGSLRKASRTLQNIPNGKITGNKRKRIYSSREGQSCYVRVWTRSYSFFH
jgi:hypothetical protein